jgi:PLP dependent protein
MSGLRRAWCLASFATMTIAENLADILARIEAARKAAIMPAGCTRLVAVSKTASPSAVADAIAAGQRLFGENRVQEAQGKFPQLKAEFPDLQLHLIGPLQTNKVKDAVALFDCIQTLDRVKLADALATERDKIGTVPDLFLQVNTGEEPQKSGVIPAEVAGLIAHVRKLELPLRGLMCIPPAQDDAAPHFAFLAKLARDHGLADLSMGMSDDFELAIRFGATHVRVGTAIFGPRAG